MNLEAKNIVQRLVELVELRDDEILTETEFLMLERHYLNKIILVKPKRPVGRPKKEK